MSGRLIHCENLIKEVSTVVIDREGADTCVVSNMVEMACVDMCRVQQ